jgi:hypothetical protein
MEAEGPYWRPKLQPLILKRVWRKWDKRMPAKDSDPALVLINTAMKSWFSGSPSASQEGPQSLSYLDINTTEISWQECFRMLYNHILQRT